MVKPFYMRNSRWIEIWFDIMKNKITIQCAKAQQNSFKFHLNNLPFLTFAYEFYKKLFDPSDFNVDDNQIVLQI